MNLDAIRSGTPSCPSDLLLDRLHAGELQREEETMARAHVASCGHCTTRVAEREKGFAALPAVDERVLLAGIRRGLERPGGGLWARLRGLRFGLIALAAASAAALLVVPLRRPTQEGQVLRPKGGLALHVFRLRDGKAEAAVSGDRFSPGDRIRFVVDLPNEGLVRVLGVEQSGALYLAWPLDGGSRSLFKAGDGIPLEGAVQLDQSEGRETLWLLHCAPGVTEPRCTAGAGGRPSCPAGCNTTPFVLEKAR